MSQLFTAEMLRNADGKLEYVNKSDKDLFKKYTDGMKVGERVKIMVDFSKEDGIAIQRARVHAMIGDMAKETGNEFDEIKKEVKRRAGLFNPDESLKSFGTCSMIDLTAAIQAAMSLGEYFGMTLK